jgi:DNA-binding NarL/FixJ family response regulator
METIRLYIIEDQPAILKAQVKLLSTFNDIQIVGYALSGEDALNEIKNLKAFPHVVLSDLGLPGFNGIEVTRRLRSLSRSIEILIFTVFEEEDKVLDAVRAGAAGYLVKGTGISKIHEAIKEVYHGGTVIQPSLARRLLKHFSMPLIGKPSHFLRGSTDKSFPDPFGQLTDRELECLQIIAKGLSNAEAADVLQLSRATIRTHIEHIYQKLDVSNRVEAVTEGLRQGIIRI